MNARRIAVGILLILQGQFVMALEPGTRLEQYVRTIWTVDRGLPQSTVFGVTQSPDGYIWIATQEGFVRFDGSQFVTYDRSTRPEIISNFSFSIRSTRSGAVFVGTVDGGLVRLQDGTITVMTEANGLPSSNVPALLESADGTLWIGTSSGLARFSNGRVSPFPSQELPHVTITALAEDRSGRLWIGTEGGLASLKEGRMTRYGEEGLASEPILSLCAARDGSVWVGPETGGLYRYQAGKVTKYLETAGLASARVTAIFEDSRGILWIGTRERGFGRWRGDHVEFDTANALPVTSFFEDSEGNIWIGLGGGLIRLADGLVLTFSKSEGVLDDDVKTVTGGSAGTVWVGTRQGLNELRTGRQLSKKDGLSSAYVLSAWMARDSTLWVGTADGGVNHVHARGVRTYTTKEGLPADGVLALFEDRRGAIWVGTSAGAARIAEGKVEPIAQLAGEPISTFTETRDGAIWIGTHEHGVTRIHGNSVTSFNTRNGLSSNIAVSIYEDTAGTIWIGTSSGGLNRLKDGKLSAIGTQQGLNDDSVFAILEDRHGNLWMSCNKGIFRATLNDLNAVADRRQKKLQSVIYGRTDGMKSRECNGGTQPVAWKAPDGKLWFATTGGASMIDTEKALQGGSVPPVLISEVLVDREPIAADARIPPGHRTLEFHYTSPTFKTPDKLRFQYWLKGFDTDWVDAQTRRVAYYTNVPPGHFTFQVRATNGDGITGAPTTMALVVEPSFYQTPLFWAIAVILFVAAAWMALRWRIGLIRAQAERFKLLFDRNLAGVYRARIDGRILDCNQAGLRILGLSSADEVGHHNIFDSYARSSEAEELIERLRANGAVSGVETSLLRPDGTPIVVLQNVSLAGTPDDEILEATIIDITDRKRAEEQIRYQAYHDALTDLPNRSLFKDRLAQAVAHAERRGRQVAVLFLDLDRFKLINDTLGHTIGDHLLQAIGDRLTSCVREEDSVARVGGDEFTVLMMDVRRPGDAMVVARKILDLVAQPITVDGHELFVTCSIGISMSPDDGNDAEALLKNADNALYRAKEAGKNNYQLCTPSMTQIAAERLTLENSLRQGLDRNEFMVVYQPQYDLGTRSVVAAEALVRWNRPGSGVVLPAEFIAAAEESRLIVPIGEFVLETAAQQARMWGDEFPLRIAVNVSAAQFRQRHLVRTIRNSLEELQVDPTRLEVEITESTAMLNPDITAEILEELKALGISIVIDDFGIGHSSLNYLKRFPIDGLKIDRTFVQDMTSDASDAGIVAAVIAMAHALNLRVTAEGVETQQQLAILEGHGCSLIQGYLLSRPVSAERLTEMMRTGIALGDRALPHTA